MRILLTILVLIFAPVLTEQGLQIGEININNQKIKIMKMNLNNPAFLQNAGNAGKTLSLFYVTSLADSNEITFDGTKLGAFADNVQYSTDNEETWNQLTAGTVITLGDAETVYFRNYTKEVYSEEMATIILKTSDLYSVGGDITALFYPGGELPDFAFAAAFMEDSNLISASALILPATSLAKSCYQSMFGGCTGLTAAPNLPATTLAESCYLAMFGGCTGLTAAPNLPATTLAEYCYQSMFTGCTGLTAAPNLPATTLAKSCYDSMFYGCTGLTAAPILLVTSLAESCYKSMFYGCTGLTEITCLATDISADGCVNNWLGNVADEGTFTKSQEMNDWPTGTSGIPSGWTVQNQ